MDPLEPEPLRADVTVVGAGAAGLYAALTAASEGASVALVSRSPLAQTASYWAQGGIAAALADDDAPELHAADTLAAGRDAARESAVRVLCEESPARVRDLERLGVRFDADRRGNLALGLEGGHSRRRIVHAGGAATGRRITRELSALVAVHERIEVLEPAAASALLRHAGRCVGLVARRRDGRGRAVLARAVILATGGMAALWERTTNPRGAVGAGLSLAVAAGAELADLEFMQFHPTALRLDGPRDGFLITEAVRGEGATLLNAEGERFVDELAPRDQVALAIQAELTRSGARAVGLDVRAVDLQRFPNIAAALDEVGLDPARETLPVAPAAHYTMGGVASDLYGRSSLAGLYAVGEAACTGLHGANRLASNSLAECFVFGRRAALAAVADPAPPPLPPHAGDVEIGPPAEATRAALWRHAGLERDPAGLRRLLADPHPLARLIAASCVARAESRGAHQRTDAPATDPALDRMHTLVGAGAGPRFERWT
ncbi:MAG TPA: FAD-dependent oxidoreductase [Thermoleophilaceae bacterium]|nr:FAD-dependent oxidoreductase [Thermoleophilaceae bacterium]